MYISVCRMYPVFLCVIYQFFWYSTTWFISSLFRYGCINPFFSVIHKLFICRCDIPILLFSMWCINTVFLNDMHQSYFCVWCMNSIFLYMIYHSSIALECMISTILILYYIFFCMLLPDYWCINRSLQHINPFIFEYFINALFSVLGTLILCIYVQFNSLHLSFFLSIPILSVSFIYFAVNLHRRFWITLFCHHFVYKTCAVFTPYMLWKMLCTGHVVHDFTFSYLLS